MSETLDGNKGIKLSVEAARLSKDVSAFVIVKIDNRGFATVTAEGSLEQICYMSKSFDNFINKILDGTIKKNG